MARPDEIVREAAQVVIGKLTAQRDDLLAVLKDIADRAGRRGILTLSTFDLANIRDVIAKVQREDRP